MGEKHYLGGEEVIIDVVGEAGHLLEAGAGAVLKHLVKKINLGYIKVHIQTKFNTNSNY